AAAVVGIGAEGGDLDDFPPEHHVREPEAAPDQAAVAEQRLDLLRGGVGGDVEVLGAAAHQQVAHGPAHQVGAEAGIAEAVEHPERILADVLARDVVPVARDHLQFDRHGGWGGRVWYGHLGGLAAVRDTLPCGRAAPYTSKPTCSLRLEA